MSRFLDDDRDQVEYRDDTDGYPEDVDDDRIGFLDDVHDDEYDPEDDEYHGDDEYYGDGDGDEPMPPPARRRWSWLKNLLAIGISLAVLLGGGYLVYSFVTEKYQEFTSNRSGENADYPGPGVSEVEVVIPVGATLTDMANILTEADVVASPNAFVNAAAAEPDAASIQPGTYRMLTQMNAKDAVARLMDRANMVLNQVTVREGLTNRQVVQVISEGTGIPVADVEAALADPAALGLPAWSNGATEGFLFPQTYAYDTDPTAVEILSQMTAHFNQVVAALDFEAKAAARGVSAYDAVTIASIIEKETGNPQYAPDVSQVIYNRLALGMPLQMDSTVHYADNSYGEVTTTDEQRANQSPYNTYVHPGLPPGAISNPGETSLSAAVNPTSGDYLYFVTVNPDTGETKFASDDAGHQQNVAEFQSWCQANSDRCG